MSLIFTLLAQASRFGNHYDLRITPMMQPQQAPKWAPFISLGGICCGLSIGIIISAIICLLLYNAQKAVPAEHRKIEPGMVWLLLIPLFNLVWNFFVFLRISESYESYFKSIGRSDVGDAGRTLGMAYAICAVCTIIPCLGMFAGLASLVLLIIYLVKIYGFKNQIGPTSGGAFPVTPPKNPQ